MPFRGGYTCSCVVKSLPLVEAEMKQLGLIQDHIDIFQLGYRSDVSASAGTHNAGGCVDVAQYHGAQIQVWREWGWTMQRRDLSGVKTHAHGWPYKCTHLAPAAQRQEADWDRKDAGLVGSAQVVGMWPVLPWDEALDEKVNGLPSSEEVATKTLEIDGLIKNQRTDGSFVFSPTAGEFISLKNAVYEMGKDLAAIKAALKIAV